MYRTRCIIIIAVGLLACRGADGVAGPRGPAGQNGAQGATGPTGVTGPAGPVGPSNGIGASITYSRVAAESIVDFPLPLDIGTETRPPVVVGYLSNNPTGGSWVQVSDAFDVGGPFITLQYARGFWTISMRNVPIGDMVILVVHY